MSKKPPIAKKTAGRPTIGPQRQIRASESDWDRWRIAAEAAGITRSEWIRRALSSATG